jgi:hypothetical protein
MKNYILRAAIIFVGLIILGVLLLPDTYEKTFQLSTDQTPEVTFNESFDNLFGDKVLKDLKFKQIELSKFDYLSGSMESADDITLQLAISFKPSDDGTIVEGKVQFKYFGWPFKKAVAWKHNSQWITKITQSLKRGSLK